MAFLSIRDSLTGLYNESHLQERIDAEVARAQRHNTSFALLFIRIERFEEFNEQFGHENGNLALLRIVNAVRSDLRASDVVFRSGGDELVVFLPEADKEGARVPAEKILRAIRGIEWSELTGRDGEARLTASIAVVAYPKDGETKEALGASARRAFAEAESAGGDCIAIA